MVVTVPGLATAAPVAAMMAANDAGTGVSPYLVGGVALGLGALLQAGSIVYTLFATRREVEAHKAELSRRVEAVEKRLDAVDDTMDGHVGTLHEKINRVDRAVSVVETETRLQTKTLERIELALVARGLDTRPTPPP